MGPNMDLFTSTLMLCMEEGEEEGTAVAGAEETMGQADGAGAEADEQGGAASGESPVAGLDAALAQLSIRRAVSTYLGENGIAKESVTTALEGVLSGCKGCASKDHPHTPSSATAAASAAAAALSTSAATRSSRPRPRLPRPPLLAVAFDKRMLLHEARADRSARQMQLEGPIVPFPPSPPRPHPERPDRLRAIAQHLFAQGLLQQCLYLPPRLAQQSELETVHSAEHCRLHLLQLPAFFAQQAAAGAAAAAAAVSSAATEGGSDTASTHHMFDSDTYANVFTGEAALLAAGGVLACVEAVVKGRADRGLALVRPPGHHADAEKSQGFCIYNNVAVAAAVARKEWGVRRVLVLDWDVHHGNGTCCTAPFFIFV